MLFYFLQANLYLTLFCISYRLLLRSRNNHSWSRAYLLLSCGMALLLPLLPVPAYGITQQWIPAINLPEVGVGPSAEIKEVQAFPPLPLVYACISLLLLLRLAGQYLRLALRVKRGQVVWLEGIRTITNSGIGPGSFLRYIFLPGADTDPAILHHEMAHIRYGHYYDKVLMGILSCLFFPLLPLYWLRRQLELVHEFQADAAACDQKDSYSALLLNQYFHTGQFSGMHTFFHHPLKHRIMMLQRPSSLTPARKVLLLAGSIVSIGVALAVQSCTRKETAPTAIKPDLAQEQVFKTVAYQPEFPGGDQALLTFLGNTVKYPSHEERLQIEGTVMAQFIVNKAGKIGDVQIVRKVSPALDAEVIRVINAMPDWKPGRNEKGQAVNVYFRIPITFKASKQNTPSIYTTSGDQGSFQAIAKPKL